MVVALPLGHDPNGKWLPVTQSGTTGHSSHSHNSQYSGTGYANTSTHNGGWGSTGGGFHTSSVTDLDGYIQKLERIPSR